ncbi:hypothetical protein [Streptosporangium sp. CA-115845]|uniref:hypothetical protein n=1 Tax=Streptosporangium sp. CA-115845 TaxID=3240071 RepID=UPI003D911DE1
MPSRSVWIRRSRPADRSSAGQRADAGPVPAAPPGTPEPTLPHRLMNAIPQAGLLVAP